MTGYRDRIRTPQPLHSLKPLTVTKPIAVQPASSPRVLMRKYAGMVLVTLAFAGCCVPVVIFAMQTAQYIFGR